MSLTDTATAGQLTLELRRSDNERGGQCSRRYMNNREH